MTNSDTIILLNHLGARLLRYTVESPLELVNERVEAKVGLDLVNAWRKTIQSGFPLTKGAMKEANRLWKKFKL
jgi:hypothetical protein